MSWWKKALNVATGGAVNLDKGPKAPKFGDEENQTLQKRTVGKTQQAGGGQIKFNTEESFMGPASAAGNPNAPKIINPQFNQNAVNPKKAQYQQKIKNFYTDLQSKINGAMGTNEEGMRSDAAKRLIKYE